MIGTDIQNGYYQDHRRIENTLPGRKVPWLARLRSEALERFMAHGFPSSREENWKYIDQLPLKRRHFRPARAERPLSKDDLVPYLPDDHARWRMVFVNGRFAPSLSRLEGLPAGVTVAGLAATLEHEPAMLEPYLGRYADINGQGFGALNTAFMNDGAYIRLGPGAIAEEPVHLVYVASGAGDSVAHVRNLVVAGENSQGTLVETYLSLDDESCFTNVITEVISAQGAHLAHYKLGQESVRTLHMAGIYIHQGRDSQYAACNVAGDGQWVRNDLNVVLDGEGGDCTLNGLYFTAAHQQVEHHTRIDHRAGHGTSRQLYKGVMDDHSRGIFSGRVVVHPNAQKTDARQTNNNLLLSENAEAVSRPQLEIYADDVKCAHGSTVGYLDEEALFYLRSRALDEDHARNLLVYAFASDILQQITLMPVRAYLERRLANRFLKGPPSEA